MDKAQKTSDNLNKYRKKSNPCTALERPCVNMETEDTRFQGSWHMKDVSLSAFYTSGNIRNSRTPE
jgi:hypothetical protein